jgi:hypothetical protein
LHGKVPARPGRYLGIVRLAAADNAAKRVVVPVTVEVAASAAWGAGYMLLGLMALGLVSVLEGEGQLHDKQREVLEAAQSFHERLERSQYRSASNLTSPMSIVPTPRPSPSSPSRGRLRSGDPMPNSGQGSGWLCRKPVCAAVWKCE